MKPDQVQKDQSRVITYGWVLLIIGTLAVLIWSRTAGLGLSFYHDEIYTISRYIQHGPEGIFFEPYEPNNHILFNLLTWSTWLFAGNSEVALRLWAVVPSFLATVILAVWAMRRFGISVGTTAGVILTTSPFVAQHAVLARGYGLALGAMCGAIIAGHEAMRHGSRKYLAFAMIAGLIGVLTLPVFALAFFGIAAALFWRLSTDRRLIVWLLLGCGVVAALWYAPVLAELVADSAQEYGDRIPVLEFLVAPIRFLIFPSLRLFVPGVQYTVDVVGADPPGIVVYWYLTAGLLVALGIWLLWRKRDLGTLILLALPVVFSFLALSLLGFHVETRFVSFLLVPLSLFLGFGVEASLGKIIRKTRHVLTVVWLVVGTGFLAAALPDFDEMTSTPLEAFEEVGQLVATTSGDVLTNSRRPTILAFYIDRDLTVLSESELEDLFCSTTVPMVFIEHPLFAESVDTSCLAQRGAQRTRFLQRDRGDFIDVWDLRP